MALALLFLTVFDDNGIIRAWKGMDWEVLDRLHDKGFIQDPKNKNKSVMFTEEGYSRCRELFKKHFGLNSVLGE
jgi:hypothetical protein